ncbi:class I SAM-dependent methyltransferase [Delftia tsuruhatensis]|uniref:class I SAM-dependent methyltransferase n=1 Tax=Delftia tsuruhatensis TaxID=180282 RepID=UPI0020901E0A|nr:class I SAM-dependent methyltransferase [Delftia tsuruhatensis]MCO5337975.1 class I SAM-dependent methyltransferase [Delftia tsuruhatensis]MCR4544981.1 class I SAM-dependent methyltransferase [Delftia tsuruhatensis]
MNTDLARQPHAALDILSRHKKARKIEVLLNLSDHKGVLKVLEIGTGSGWIANYFGKHSSLQCEVVAVDIFDNRQIFEGYEYIQVQGVKLPFDPENFDLVISNHVIEHVGEENFQKEHLAEIARVLRKSGKAYIAVPNRWMLNEPHYQLKFLSWLPRSWRTPYLRMMGKGDFYDCEPLEMKTLERMISGCGLSFENMCIQALRKTLELERPGKLGTRIMGVIPDWLIKPLVPAIPTLIYQVHHVKLNEH